MDPEVELPESRRIAARLNSKGNTVLFTNPKQSNLVARLKDYRDALAPFPGIKIAEVHDIKGDSGDAPAKAQEYLHRPPRRQTSN